MQIFLYFYVFQRITFYKNAEVEKLPNYQYEYKD